MKTNLSLIPNFDKDSLSYMFFYENDKTRTSKSLGLGVDEVKKITGFSEIHNLKGDDFEKIRTFANVLERVFLFGFITGQNNN